MLSHIQNQILSLLLRVEKSKYSEIIPEGIDRDLFNYHLRFLLDKKYISKELHTKTYTLTDFGKRYVQKLDINGNIKEYFKISVLAFLVREIDGKKEILVHKRKRHPYFGDVATISGKVHHGETIENAATRKLKEETGLICNNFKLFGVHRKIRYDSKNKLIEDTLYHCCIGTEFTGDLVNENDFGENFWIRFGDLIELQKQNITYSDKTSEVYTRIENSDYSFFYFQEEITLPSF